MARNRDERLEELILKVARGFQLAEVTEEFVEVDGEMRLTKRKKTKKDVPPDWKALQLLLGSRDDVDFSAMTDEELEQERERLLQQLRAKSVDGIGEETEDCSAENSVVGGSEVQKKRPKPRKKKPTVLNGGMKK